MRSDSVIDLVLTDVAEALIRVRSRRPVWLPAGFPMKLILTQKREGLITYLYEHPSLRTYLRTSSRRLINADLLAGVTDVNFNSQMELSSDPRQFVATALLAEDETMVLAARPWALDPTTIPEPISTEASPPVPDLFAEEQEESPVDVQELGPLDVSGPSGDLHQVEIADLESASAESATSLDGDQVVAPIPVPNLSSREPETDPLVDALTSECDQLRSRVASLEAQLLEARARIPSTNQRRRQHRQEGKLDRAQKDLEAKEQELEALRSERDRLIRFRKEVEDQLTEAEEARQVALRKSQILERQLSTGAGRAEYLRRSIEKELSELKAAVEDLPNGKDRTERNRRIRTLTDLSQSLDLAFPKVTEPESRSRRVALGPTHDFVVTPIGGGAEIGGSAILVEAAGRRILVDAGMHPSGRGPLRIQELIDGGPVDALVITHAHNDHAGYVPALVSKFPRMKVICSDATQHLLPTMWADSAKVMNRNFDEAEDGASVTAPLYGLAEAEAAEGQIEVHGCHRPFSIGDLHLTLFPAGHILGAVGVVIEGGHRRIVITGDISGLDDHYLSVESASIPEGLVSGADLLVIETTYCNSEHEARKSEERGLVEVVRSVIERRGRVLIPAFGLGRSQEVVMILEKMLPDVDILVDGLAKDITRIYETVAEDAGRSLSIFGGRVQPVQNRSRELRSFQSGVIVASSGMLTGGPSVAWAKSILPDERAALLLCGYQDEEAPGRRLEYLARGQTERTIRLPDEDFGWVEVPVRAEVGKYGLSAHADKVGLIDIIERVHPENTMLVHGLPQNQAAFRAELHRKQIHTVPTERWSSCPE